MGKAHLRSRPIAGTCAHTVRPTLVFRTFLQEEVHLNQADLHESSWTAIQWVLLQQNLHEILMCIIYFNDMPRQWVTNECDITTEKKIKNFVLTWSRDWAAALARSESWHLDYGWQALCSKTSRNREAIGGLTPWNRIARHILWSTSLNRTVCVHWNFFKGLHQIEKRGQVLVMSS